MQYVGQTMCILTLTVLLILGLNRAQAAALPNARSNEIEPRKVVYEMDMDNFIDENMDTIRGVAWELDPMELDDVNFPVTKHIYMYLHTGWAQNIAQLQRAGKCSMRYSDKKLNIDLNLGWEDLVFDYRYLIKVIFQNRKGDLHGQMTKLNIHIGLEINFKNYHITLKTLELQEKGQINISLEGHMLDWWYNLAIKAVTHTFRTITLNTIKDKLRGMILHRIDEINFKLGSMVNRHQFEFIDLTIPQKHDNNSIYKTIADKNQH